MTMATVKKVGADTDVVDDDEKALAKKRRKAIRDQKALNASRYEARAFIWDHGGKPKAMDDWSQWVMASNASRKALKAAWALSFAFNSTDGACYEKKEQLAKRCGLGVQSLKDGLTELEKLCLIRRQKESRRGKLLTVIYPTEPALKGSCQSRQEHSETVVTVKTEASWQSRQHRLDSHDPCILEGSERGSLNPYSESTERYIGVAGLSERERDSERSSETEELVDDDGIPY